MGFLILWLGVVEPPCFHFPWGVWGLDQYGGLIAPIDLFSSLLWCPLFAPLVQLSFPTDVWRLRVPLLLFPKPLQLLSCVFPLLMKDEP
ncbi:hypothetical protein FGO68_gene8347 [Halteria grandinella]|uniref:Uncharacterized protein n=1 Tax=Halteria grandinella TaxID=5974 RepID=A0A8J8P5V1_HALGN|nr:hypothetical protein FGO68_gene8347 [Halteria grandinella]